MGGGEAGEVLAARRRGDTAALRAALTDPRDRPLAARFLAELGCDDAIPEIARLLDASDAWARVSAVRALGKLQARPFAARLRTLATDDPHEQVRLWSIAALGELGDRRERGFLEQLLQSGDWKARRATVYALGALGDPAALPALRRARRSDLWCVLVPLRSGHAYREAIRSLVRATG